MAEKIGYKCADGMPVEMKGFEPALVQSGIIFLVNDPLAEPFEDFAFNGNIIDIIDDKDGNLKTLDETIPEIDGNVK